MTAALDAATLDELRARAEAAAFNLEDGWTVGKESPRRWWIRGKWKSNGATASIGYVPGPGMGDLAAHIAGLDPATVLALIAAAEAGNRDRATIERVKALLEQPSPPNYDGQGSFHGLVGGPEHRTVGSHRAWCFQESEWCYPLAPCRACLEPIDQADLRAALTPCGTDDSIPGPHHPPEEL